MIRYHMPSPMFVYVPPAPPTVNHRNFNISQYMYNNGLTEWQKETKKKKRKTLTNTIYDPQQQEVANLRKTYFCHVIINIVSFYY